MFPFHTLSGWTKTKNWPESVNARDKSAARSQNVGFASFASKKGGLGVEQANVLAFNFAFNATFSFLFWQYDDIFSLKK